ncbi:hypothetical protein AMATHDRAFT_121203, partial [Amanita thiersii Skay4041]
YDEDEFFRKVLGGRETYLDFKEKDRLVYKRMGDSDVLCIPNVLIGKRSVREMIIDHAHSLLAHLGHKKTLQLLREETWW